MKKILFLLLAFTLLSLCSCKNRGYDGEVTYKWSYNSIGRQNCLEVSVNNGDIIFCEKVSKSFYDSINVGDSVNVEIFTPTGIYGFVRPWPFITIHRK